MKLKPLAAALVLAVAGPAAMAATCTATSSLGNLTPPDLLNSFGNSFTSVGTYTDCYQFQIGTPADAFGGTTEWDLSLRRDIDVTSISLYGGQVTGNQTGSLWGTDSTPGLFSFGPLSAGWWTLAVVSDVTGRNGGLLGGGEVGYTGRVSTTRAQAVPEPGTLALLGIALTGAAFARRRKQA